jgi:hypothetical protein
MDLIIYHKFIYSCRGNNNNVNHMDFNHETKAIHFA